jgi:hypothetical protein
LLGLIAAGRIGKIRLLGDLQHSTRIAFIEFIDAEAAMAALNCSGALLGEWQGVYRRGVEWCVLDWGAVEIAGANCVCRHGKYVGRGCTATAEGHCWVSGRGCRGRAQHVSVALNDWCLVEG